MSLGEISASTDIADSKALVVPDEIQYHTAILLPYLAHNRTLRFSWNSGPHPCHCPQPYHCLETLVTANCPTKEPSVLRDEGSAQNGCHAIPLALSEQNLSLKKPQDAIYL